MSAETSDDYIIWVDTENGAINWNSLIGVIEKRTK